MEQKAAIRVGVPACTVGSMPRIWAAARTASTGSASAVIRATSARPAGSGSRRGNLGDLNGFHG
jgi:hypothetical protein